MITQLTGSIKLKEKEVTTFVLERNRVSERENKRFEWKRT
jgi:hypothetical protein